MAKAYEMNPFKVLGVTQQATHKEIIQGVGQAMRSRQYSAQTIARAQKLLLDPESRVCQTFLHFVDVKDAKNGMMRDMAGFCEQIEQQRAPGELFRSIFLTTKPPWKPVKSSKPGSSRTWTMKPSLKFSKPGI